MARIAVVLVLFIGFAQTKSSSQEIVPQHQEEIQIVLPDLYWSLQDRGPTASIGTDYELNPPPKGITRKYFISCEDGNGNVIHEPVKLDDAAFYTLAKRILSYGVRDSVQATNYINRRYQEFVRIILKHRIINEVELKKVGKKYYEYSWIESFYWLQSVVPNVITAEELQALLGRSFNDYFTVFVRLSSGIKPDTVRVWLDEQFFLQTTDQSSSIFSNFAQIYGVVAAKGAAIPASVQKRLFASYLDNYFPLDGRGIRGAYADLQLPIPDKAVLASVMEDFVRKQEIPLNEIVPEFRCFGLSFPKQYAVAYRDRLLARSDDITDVLYLVEEAGEDAKSELWNKYAYSALRSYLRRSYLRGDYYRAAVEGYRRVAKAGIPIDRSITECLAGAVDDASVRMRDILIAYRLADRSPKSALVILQLENRLEQSRDLREEIDVADFLGDPERIKALSRKISLRFFEKLKKEQSPSMDSQTFKELSAILDAYEELKFTIGARSLALHLFDMGFVLPARRAFHLGGLGKEAEERYYKNFCDDALRNKQETFNANAQKPLR